MSNGAIRIETSAKRKTRTQTIAARSPPLSRGGKMSNTIRGESRKDKMTKPATTVEVVGGMTKPHGKTNTILDRTTIATGVTTLTMHKKSRETLDQVPHDEAHE